LFVPKCSSVDVSIAYSVGYDSFYIYKIIEIPIAEHTVHFPFWDDRFVEIFITYSIVQSSLHNYQLFVLQLKAFQLLSVTPCQLAGCFECSSENLGSIKWGQFLGYLRAC